ncbi:MAG: DUF3750 domain-containing protein, partial [Candidatus Rokubacteria bacterium]|nr:DUF3750 domain-containing protein [Candidatus Rokubacteria bacterium]
MTASARRPLLAALGLALLAHVPSGCAARGRSRDFWNARRDSSGQAPSAETTPGAVVQGYAARAVGWRGVVGVHTWIAVKRRGAAWHRYEVIGWGVDQGAPAVRVVILIQ